MDSNDKPDNKSQDGASEPKGQEAPPYSGPLWTIYCHTHIATGRKYVGLTKKRMLQRWNEHVHNAKSKRGKGCRHFWNAIRSYGKDAFSHEVLETCNMLEAANEAEERWIATYDTMNPEKGFNLCPAKHTPHPVKNPWDRPGFREKYPKDCIKACFTPEARAAQKAALTKETRSAATKAVFARPEVQAFRAALNADPEHRARISRASRAARETPEVKARFSEAVRELWTRPEYREKVSLAVKEKLADPEIRKKLSAASKKAWTNPETRAKMSQSPSDETRAKISAASSKHRHSEESKAEMRRLFLERRDRQIAEAGVSTWSEFIKLKIRMSKAG